MMGQATRSRLRRVTCADESCCGARETERYRFCSSDAGAIDAAEGGQHTAGGAVYPRCIIWLVMFVGACAVSVRGYKVTAGVAVSLYVQPSSQRRHRHCVCVRVTTDHSNTSTRLQCHQQYLRLRASEPLRSPAAAGKPCTCSRQTSFPSNFAHN